MAMTTNEVRRQRWAVAALFAALPPVGMAVMAAYALVADKPLTFSSVVGPFCGFWVLAPFAPLLIRKVQMPQPFPEAWQGRLVDALRAEGLEKVRLSYLGEGPSATFPRPMALGYQVSISKRVLEEFSPEAVLWSVKTDATAAIKFIGWGFAAFLIPVLIGFLGMALCERWHAPSGFYALPASFIGLGFFLTCVIGMRTQYAADRRFTVTEADRRAAKEALSFPFFAQADRKASERWIFSRVELRKRAERLGIELERGYRAS